MNAKQAARRYDIERGHILAEVLERRERAVAFLGLIEEEKRAPGYDVTPHKRLQVGDDAIRLDVTIECGF